MVKFPLNKYLMAFKHGFNGFLLCLFFFMTWNIIRRNKMSFSFLEAPDNLCHNCWTLNKKIPRFFFRCQCFIFCHVQSSYSTWIVCQLYCYLVFLSFSHSVGLHLLAICPHRVQTFETNKKENEKKKEKLRKAYTAGKQWPTNETRH